MRCGRSQRHIRAGDVQQFDRWQFEVGRDNFDKVATLRFGEQTRGKDADEVGVATSATPAMACARVICMGGTR